MLLFIGTIVLAFVCFNYGTKFDNAKLDQYPKLEDAVGEDVKTSLKSISDNNYASDKNNIEVVIESDDKLGFSSINRLIAEQLTYTDGYLYGSGVAGIQNVLLCPYKDGDYNIAIKLEVKLLGFYQTTVRIIGKATYEDNNINVVFDKYKLGPVPVFEWIVKMLPLDQINISNDIFDLKRVNGKFNMTINLAKVLENMNSNSYASIILNAPKELQFNEKDLTIKIDTSKIFKQKYNFTIPQTKPYHEETKAASLIANHKIELNDDEINYLIKDDLAEINNKISTQFKIGETSFNVKVTEVYLDLASNALLINLQINDTYAPIKAVFNINLVKSGTYVSKLVISKNKIYVGDTEIKDFSFDNVEIEASKFNFGTLLKATNIEIKDGKMVITYSL